LKIPHGFKTIMLNSLDLPGDPATTRIAVAMSGGVDSSVVAGLLKQQGYDVVGITLQLYDMGEAAQRKGACCAGQDIYDAHRAAEIIGIPHYVLDYESRFKESVIEKFADSYLAGETPIPCVECNRSVKFHDLLGMAKDLGAQALATGHYVASRTLESRPSLPQPRRALYRAADPARDQSYFLYATTAEQLDYLRFPLGDKPKTETRALAHAMGLPIADKPDSQDICFVPGGRYADVIERLRPGAVQSGDIIHLDGRVMGRHEGVIHFTVGQRRGLGVATGEPLFVIRVDAARAEVIVGPREALQTSLITLRDVNWLGDMPLADIGEEGLEIAARVRSTRPPCPALIRFINGNVQVELLKPEDGVAPGQACVFYDSIDTRARVLGGGVIMRKS
jgi:tRNA-uridine 2-sulfurtransferase